MNSNERGSGHILNWGTTPANTNKSH